MALTKCPECGKEVSSKAVACPHCGFPLGTTPKEPTQIEQPQPIPETADIETFHRQVASAQVEPPRADALPKIAGFTNPSTSIQPESGFGCGGCFTIILLLVGVCSICMGLFGWTQKNRVLAIPGGSIPLSDKEASSDERTDQALFGVSSLIAAAIVGWKYCRPKT